MGGLPPSKPFKKLQPRRSYRIGSCQISYERFNIFYRSAVSTSLPIAEIAEDQVRSFFKFTAVSAPILAGAALLASSTPNLRASLSPLPIPPALTSGTSASREQDDTQPLVWVQLEQDGSYLTLAEALKL
ncbi:hypothetical protein, partial [Candidatus Synechococcus spongiarum]|uniref:hypothetical protein n=1 Tax=Candidatus Synechococcus spongiarum TaxID=431041 RepID=UPI001378C31B